MGNQQRGPTGTGEVPKPKSIVTEVGIFGLFMAIVLSIATYFTLTGLKNAPDLLGLPRSLALGAPMALIAACFAVFGLAVVLTRSAVAVLGVMSSAIALAGAYLLFGLLTVPSMLVTPLALAIYAIPTVVFFRGRKALTELSSATPQPRVITPSSTS